MIFDLETRRVRMSVGELSEFALGPRGSSGGGGGLWRAQLGSRWHRDLREREVAAGTDADFEVPIEGEVAHRGWLMTFAGRIDQVLRTDGQTTLREIKTVTLALPMADDALRDEHPDYFVQLATYVALYGQRNAPAFPPPASTPPVPTEVARKHSAQIGAIQADLAPAGLTAPPVRGELLFIEADTGLAQAVALSADDALRFRERLDRVADFLDLRQRARERLRGLRFRAPFGALRAGQETVQAELAAAIESGRSAILLEAPTGFGKTGVLLERALGDLRAGRFERVLYLTGKSTGQLQVARTLASMTAPGPDLSDGGAQVAAWHVRNKAEHCVNEVFHCVKDVCPFLANLEERWPGSGLSRFYLLEDEPRDLASLRAAGLGARICPYEITRASLPFNDVWIADFNYVFAPDNRRFFYERPGFDAARTLLIIDEAHNLPSRVADAHSHGFTAFEAQEVVSGLNRVRAQARLVDAWDGWAHFLRRIDAAGALSEAQTEDARELLGRVAEAVSEAPVDQAELGPDLARRLWSVPAAVEQFDQLKLPMLWWSPRSGDLLVTCLDAAAATGAALREFGGVILATATPGPTETFAEACGLTAPPEAEALPLSRQEERPARLGELNQRQTRKVYTQITSGAELLKVEEARASAALCRIEAHTPWRTGAYRVGIDLRADTTFQQRSQHYATTAATVAALARAAGGAVAVFFPSYAYAEAISAELATEWPEVRVALQPRRQELTAQAAWVENGLLEGSSLFLVLGSGFAESIDLLGGRVSHAMVVGPALPEVNPVQRAKLAEFSRLGRDAAFDRVYRIPGMQKVNQALGRLVRAPGQRATVLLHCRRFAEAGYARLLAADYQGGRVISGKEAFEAWLGDA